MSDRTKVIEPSVHILNTPIEMKREAGLSKVRSRYFNEGATEMRVSKTPLLAIVLAYFAMEHKANEILALKGYKIKDHVCIIKAMSRIIERSDLAKLLQEAYTERLNTNYLLSFSTSDQDKFKAEQFLREYALKFINEIDQIIQNS